MLKYILCIYVPLTSHFHLPTLPFVVAILLFPFQIASTLIPTLLHIPVRLIYLFGWWNKRTLLSRVNSSNSSSFSRSNALNFSVSSFQYSVELRWMRFFWTEWKEKWWNAKNGLFHFGEKLWWASLFYLQTDFFS